ncbi:MAG: Tol-Pal system beta propeller repeat protein TolB [Deltaproteobacteria bacterium]
MIFGKHLLTAALALVLAIAHCLPALAEPKIYIDLSAPAARKIPLAIQGFGYIGKDGANEPVVKEIAKEIVDALRSDLLFSNLFGIIDEKAHPSTLQEPHDTVADFEKWRQAGADGLIKGGFSVEGGRLTIEIRYFDCLSEKQVTGRRFTGSVANARRVVHYFSDMLHEELTGERGIFTTRIMFVSPKSGNKEVYIADYDGKNAIQITRNGSTNLFPQWAPDGKSVIYVSYKKRFPFLYRLDLATGKDTVISSRPGVNIGARFSPDGTKIALTLSGPKSPELNLLDLKTGGYTRLTDNYAIDISPAWSADGSALAFVSDSAGNPNIFMLNFSDNKPKRLTYTGAFNASPAWSPDSGRIAFARQDNGRFNIWVMDPDGSDAAQLTFEGNNKNPSWSPDGRHLIFSSESRGQSSLYIMRPDGTGLTRLSTGIGNETAPVWSPLPLPLQR